MTASFFEQLEARAWKAGSLLCIGLDPHLPDLAAPTPEAALDFCRRTIDATIEVAAAYKPNSAFFEVFGAEGWRTLAEVIAAVPADIPVILDAKRGDIASTAQAYAAAAFGTLQAGAVTLSPYLGGDTLTPFLQSPEHGIFLLCKTSNPGAGDLQDLPLAGVGRARRVYEAVAALAQHWVRSGELGSSQIGLVAGATHLQALERVRRLAPELWILAPGVGAQGGDLEGALRAGLRNDNLGLLLPVSRGVTQAHDPRRAALELHDRINQARAALDRPGGAFPTPVGLDAAAGRLLPAGQWRRDLANGLLQAGCVQFGQFTLKSGLQSPFYIDLRRLIGFPDLLQQAAAAYGVLLNNLDYDRLAAVPYAGLPIGMAVALHCGRPLIYARKEAKTYGTRAEVDGVYTTGERVVVIDDLATTGGSKLEAIEKLTAAGLQVTDVVVLIDRQSGAAAALEAAGMRLHTVFTLTELLQVWEQSGKVQPEQIAAARAFIQSTA